MTINVLYCKKMYACDTSNDDISKHKTEGFDRPVVSYVGQNDLSVWYARKNTGHFGVPKLILSWGAGGYRFIDKHGEYGIGGNCWSIVDTVENLHKMNTAFDHPKMQNILDATQQYQNMRYNRNILKNLKKDFYLDFI